MGSFNYGVLKYPNWLFQSAPKFNTKAGSVTPTISAYHPPLVEWNYSHDPKWDCGILKSIYVLHQILC